MRWKDICAAEQKVRDPKAQDPLRRIRISFDLYKNRGQVQTMTLPRCEGELAV